MWSRAALVRPPLQMREVGQYFSLYIIEVGWCLLRGIIEATVD